MKPCGANALLNIACASLLAWPVLAGADGLDEQLARNMRVYSHGPAQARLAGQGLASGQAVGTQAHMVVFDRTGRASSPQRVALGPLPPPRQDAAGQPMTDYPRQPQPAKPSWELDYALNSGFREDNLNWNIAAGSNPPYHPGRPNVLSELKWTDIMSAQIGGKAEITSPGGWHFQGKVDYGFITSGNNQDSDYFANDRTGEFSRSNNSANAGNMLDASIGAGYRFARRDRQGNVIVGATPLVGYAYSEQNLVISNGVQTVETPGFTPPLGPFPGLDSHYGTQWHGPWLGFKVNAQPVDWMGLFAQYEYHWANYYGKGGWNLRSDLAQPYSFKHHASGGGSRVAAGLKFKLTPAWAFDLNANYADMTTDAGTDTTYFYDGSNLSTRLNKVQWISWGVNVGVRYRF
jgi:hypothetical protein